MEDSLHVDDEFQEDKLGDKRKPLVKQAQQYGELSATKLVEDDKVVSKLSNNQEITKELPNEQTKVESESITTEILHESAESDDKNTKIKPVGVKDEISTKIANQLSIDQAQSEENVRPTFPNVLTESAEQSTTTKHPRKVAENEGKIKVIKMSQKQAEIEDTVKTTESQIKKQVVVEGKSIVTEIQCVGEQYVENDTTNMPADEQAQVKSKSIIQVPAGFPNKSVEDEGKDATSKPPYDLEGDENNITATNFTHEQAEIEDKIVSAESLHEHGETKGKIIAFELTHNQANQTEAEIKNKLQEEYCTLDNITNLLHDAIHKKGQLIALLDEKKKTYEVDFKIQDFSVDNGNFENELEKEVIFLNQLLKQREADRDGAIKESDDLMAQINEQSVQLKEINEQLEIKSSLKLQLENEVSNLSNGIDELKKEIQDAHTEIIKTSKAMKANQYSIEKCEIQLKADTATSLELRDKKSTTEKCLEKNKESLQAVIQTIEEVNEELQKIESKLSDYKDQQTKMQKDMEDNKTNHSKSSEVMDGIKCSLDEINGKHEDLKMKQSQLQLLLDKVEPEIEEACNQKSKLQQTYNENKKTLILLQEKSYEFDKDIKKCKEEILNLEKNAFEFQEKNDMLILSCKACAKLKIKETHEKLKTENLKDFFEIWNDQIESLQEELRQLSKRFKEHMEVIEMHSVTSIKPVHVLEKIEMGYLQSLQCTTKNIYVLNVTIQHSMYQINLDDLINSFFSKCNESDEHEEGVSETEHKSKVRDTTRPPRELAAAKDKIKKGTFQYEQVEAKGNVSTDLPQTRGKKATTAVHVDIDQDAVIDLATQAKENRVEILLICKNIDTAFVKLNNARLCHEKHLSDYILLQISYWDKIQQLMKLFSQSLIDIETKIGTQEIAKIICHTDNESEIDSTEASLDTEESVKLLNNFRCSRSVSSLVDCQLALLNRKNEELKSSNATKDDSLTTLKELDHQGVEVQQLEVEKQKVQQKLHNTQEKIKILINKNQQLQEEIQKNGVSVSELTEALSCLQQDVQLKQSEIDSIITKVSQRKRIQDNMNTCNDSIANIRNDLEILKQQLQLQSQWDEFGNTKEKIFVENISKMQTRIFTMEAKSHCYKNELAELDEAEKKKPELLKILSSLQEKIMKHQLTIENTNLSIKEIQDVLDKNVSILEEHKEEELKQKDKLSHLSSTLNNKTLDYNQIVNTFVDYMVETTIQEVVQIEENRLKIKILNQNKNNLLLHDKTSEKSIVVEEQLKFEQQLYSLDKKLQEKNKALKLHQDSLEFNKKELQQAENNNTGISNKLKEAHENLVLKEKEKLEMQTNQQSVRIELQNLIKLKHSMSLKLANCEESLAQLKSKQQELEQKVTNCKDEISKLKTNKHEVTKCLNKHKGSNSSLKNEIEKLVIKLKTIKENIEKMDDSIDKRSSALNNHKANEEDLKTKNNKLQNQMDEVRKILKHREEERKAAERNSQQNLNQIRILKERKKELDVILANAKTQHELSQKQKQRLQEEYAEVKAKFNDIECIKQQKEELYCTLEKLKTQLTEVKQNKSIQYDGIQSILKTILWTLEKVNIQANNKEEKLKKKKECLEDQVKALKNEADQQKKEIDVLAMKNEGLEKQNYILEKQNSDMKRESQNLKLGNKKLEKEIEILQLARSGSVPRPIKGLVNLGNTCFFNSMLQGVNQATLLCQLLTDSQAATLKYEVPWSWPDSIKDGKSLKLEVKSKPGDFAQALWKFYQEIDSYGPDVRPLSLLSLIGRKNSRFLGRNQQDSHEAFRCLLDGLRMEEISAVREEIYKKFGTTEQEYKASSKKLSPEEDKSLKGYLRKANKVITTVDKVFGGTLVNTIVCHKCHDTPQTYEAFLDLSLPITKDLITDQKTIRGLMRRASKKLISNDDGTLQKHLAAKEEYKHKPLQHGIQLSLDEFTDLDELDKDNQFICKRCTEEKQRKSHKDDVYVLCNVSKSLIIHELPKILVLHIKRFHLEPVVRKDNDHVSFTKVLDMTPYCTTECIEKHQTKYTLFTVVVHSGSLQSGHYTAYVNGTDDTWYYTSDSHISECHSGFKEVESCQAYMLFYKQNNN